MKTKKNIALLFLVLVFSIIFSSSFVFGATWSNYQNDGTGLQGGASGNWLTGFVKTEDLTRGSIYQPIITNINDSISGLEIVFTDKADGFFYVMDKDLNILSQTAIGGQVAGQPSYTNYNAQPVYVFITNHSTQQQLLVYNLSGAGAILYRNVTVSTNGTKRGVDCEDDECYFAGKNGTVGSFVKYNISSDILTYYPDNYLDFNGSNIPVVAPQNWYSGTAGEHDWDNDGDKDIAFYSTWGGVVFDDQGNRVMAYNLTQVPSDRGTPLFINVDGGLGEIVFGGNKVRMIDSAGTQVWVNGVSAQYNGLAPFNCGNDTLVNDVVAIKNTGCNPACFKGDDGTFIAHSAGDGIGVTGTCNAGASVTSGEFLSSITTGNGISVDGTADFMVIGNAEDIGYYNNTEAKWYNLENTGHGEVQPLFVDIDLDGQLDYMDIDSGTFEVYRSNVTNTMPHMNTTPGNPQWEANVASPICHGSTVTFTLQHFDLEGNSVRGLVDGYGNTTSLVTGTYSTTNPAQVQFTYSVAGTFTTALYVQDSSHASTFNVDEANDTFTYTVADENNTVCYAPGDASSGSNTTISSAAGDITDVAVSVENALNDLGVRSNEARHLVGLLIIVLSMYAMAQKVDFRLAIFAGIVEAVIFAIPAVNLLPVWVAVLLFFLGAAIASWAIIRQVSGGE